MSDIEDLLEYAALEGTELGAECFVLDCVNTQREFYSPEFVAAYHAEVARLLNYFKSNCRIVEHTEEVTSTSKYRVLEWANPDASLDDQ